MPKMVTQSVELLAPAGSPEALDAAVACGADAVYLGLKSFNARMRSVNFAYSQFEGAVRALHRMGRRVYVTVNTVFEQREAGRVFQLLRYLDGIGPDGIIVQDFGVLTMAREFRSLRLHASTQMNIASARGANALSGFGVSRAVLARELSLEEIRYVRQGTNLELEVFVHGALCVSDSGLCLFSSFLGGKSANRGMCTQACRRLYSTNGGEASLETSPAARCEIPRASTGSGYFFSPCDLSLIGRAAELAEAGVQAFKIEGRMKSAEYVGAVVSAYRMVIDSLGGNEDQRRRALEEARLILRRDFARSKTEYFFGAAPAATEGDTAITAGSAALAAAANNGADTGGGFTNEAARWLLPDQAGGTGIPLGTILTTFDAPHSEQSANIRCGRIRRENIHGGAALSAGDSLRFHKADDSGRQTHKLLFVQAADPDFYDISLPEDFGTGDTVYLIQTKAESRHYPHVIPKDLSAFKRRPGRDSGPIRPPARKTEAAGSREAGSAQPSPRRRTGDIPEGLYAAVASPEDLYTLQSIKPAAAILPLNRKTAERLTGGRDGETEERSLPFKPGELILSLNPYFPQAMEAFFAEAIPRLLEKGYKTFIVNNPGHFSFFRNPGEKNRPVLVAGPWLYSFNAWAGAFLAEQGADYIISPLENNRQNLEKTWEGAEVKRGGRRPFNKLTSQTSQQIFSRSRVFITLFAWPPLFRIRADLGKFYPFRQFEDSRGESFLLTGGGPAEMEESVVLPETPFSIVDKRPFLESAGFRRFILDFSGGIFSGVSFPLKKHEYRDIMKAAQNSTPLSNTVRFNWKDGFFQEKEASSS